MKNQRHEFVALMLPLLRAGIPPDNAIAQADHIVSELDARFGKEEPEKSLADQFRDLLAGVPVDWIEKTFAGIPVEKVPEGTRGVTDYGGNGEPPPREREPLVTEGGKQPATGATPSWK